MAEINRLNLAPQLTIFLALEAGLLIKSNNVAAQSSSALHLNDQIKQVENAIEEGQKKKYVLDRTEADLRAQLLDCGRKSPHCDHHPRDRITNICSRTSVTKIEFPKKKKFLIYHDAGINLARC